MNYKQIYDNLISRHKLQPADSFTTLVEQHHIVPKCMGGTNELENLVKLTPREHFIAHKLLRRIFPTCLGLSKAIEFMSATRDGCKISGREYQYIKIEVRKFQSQSSIEAWNSKTEEEKKNHVQALVNGMRKWRASLTDDERKKLQKLNAARALKIWNSLPKEEQERHGKQHSQTLLNRSDDEKRLRRQKCQQTWQTKTAAELEQHRNKISQSSKAMWESKTDEQRKEFSENVSKAIRQWIENRTPEEIELMRQRSRRAHETIKKRLGNDYARHCQEIGERLQDNCKKWRESLTVEQKEALRKKHRDVYHRLKQDKTWYENYQKVQSINTASYWKSMTPEERAARGKAISEAKTINSAKKAFVNLIWLMIICDCI